MRISGRFVDRNEVSPAVDGLGNLGLDREDITISDMSGRPMTDQGLLRDENMVFGAPDSIPAGEGEGIAGGFAGLNREAGIVIAVEIPPENAGKVRGILKQCGAIEVFEG